MLPPAHYAAGLAAGLAVNKATGLPGLGLAAAASTHLLLDWLADEYWAWQPGEHLDMVKLLSPLIATAAILTLWLGGWWPLWWGLAGLAMDVIDTPVKWLTRKIGWWRPNRSEAGIELFPCHYYSPIYWGQAWHRMLTFIGTVVAEYALAVPAFLAIYFLGRG